MSRRLLLASIHDVSPRFEGEVDALLARLAPVAGERVALLAVPDHWGNAPIISGTPFATRLRRWAERGHEIFLHGWFHQDRSDHAGAAARFRAKHMTAGEGEFLGLDRAEAERRIRDGKALLEDVTGQPIAGFVAPAWLYGDGAHTALRNTGIALAEDHWKVWSPRTGQVLARSPVVTWATRSRARLRSSLWAARALRTVPMPGVMRLAVHPPDIRSDVAMASVDKTLAALARTRRCGGYGELAG
ncbi:MULTISPECIES: polysaccharide deacetylase family protein [Sphingomonas]|uniref:polysaccharide deacetylase family protein n=1 Tax=Sphingomonas TaxID=13687 RepID=UPI000DEECF4B|nr:MULTISPECIES: polysaccharide deacetylase family protein [Sphingomonas]